MIDTLALREWAVVIPSYLMLIVLLAYFTYAGITAFLTPPLSSPRYITGECCVSAVVVECGTVALWRVGTESQ